MYAELYTHTVLASNSPPCPSIFPLHLPSLSYTQFPSQDSGLFGPLENLSAAVKLPIKKVSGQPDPWNIL